MSTEAAEALCAEGYALLGSGELDQAWTAVERFERAATLDPSCVRAWVGLALAFSGPPIVFSGPGRRLGAGEAWSRAKGYVERALALDDQQPDAWRVLGQGAHYWRYDWAAAEAAYRQALSCRPGDLYTVSHLALLLASRGRFGEARDLLWPLVDQPVALVAFAFIAFFQRRFDEAVTHSRAVVDRTGGFHFFLGLTLAEAGQPYEAVEAYQAGPDLAIRNPGYIAGLARALVLCGEDAAAQRILDELSERRRTEQIVPYQVATVHAARGEVDQAFSWLGIAVEERGNWPTWLGLDPRLDRLRTDERFASLLRRVDTVL